MRGRCRSKGGIWALGSLRRSASSASLLSLLFPSPAILFGRATVQPVLKVKRILTHSSFRPQKQASRRNEDVEPRSDAGSTECDAGGREGLDGRFLELVQQGASSLFPLSVSCKPGLTDSNATTAYGPPPRLWRRRRRPRQPRLQHQKLPPRAQRLPGNSPRRSPNGPSQRLHPSPPRHRRLPPLRPSLWRTLCPTGCCDAGKGTADLRRCDRVCRRRGESRRVWELGGVRREVCTRAGRERDCGRCGRRRGRRSGRRPGIGGAGGGADEEDHVW